MIEHSHAAPASAGFRQWCWAHMMPLVHRLRRGEGLLFLVAISLPIADGDTGRLVVQSAVALVCLALLYFVNDLHDCHGDLNDPGKSRRLTEFLVTHRSQAIRVATVLHLVLFSAAAVTLGWRSTLALVSVTLVNLVYSVYFKSTPTLDAPWVAVWATLYLLVPDSGVPLGVVAIPAAMTSIAHAYQVLRDHEVDATNRIRTSAVASQNLPSVQIALSAVAMGTLLVPWLGAVGALSASIPVLLHFLLRSNQAAWLLSKLCFSAIWVGVLGSYRETI